MKRKFTSIILSLFMIFSVFVGNISNVSAAERKAGVYVNGEKLTENTEYKDSNGVVKYKYSDKVLYLNSANITKGVNFWEGPNSQGQVIDDEAGIFINTGNSSDIVTIKFNGTNKIALNKQNVSMASYGIYSVNNLILEGDENASLEVIANNAGASSVGIYCSKTLKILQGYIKATALNQIASNKASYGISTEGNITIGDLTNKKEPIIDVEGKNGHIKTNSVVTINLSCNNTLSASRKDAHLGHEMIEVSKKDATCTGNGNHKYYKCESCTNQKKYKDFTGISVYNGNENVIPASGHDNPMEHKTRKEATCTEDGNVEYYYCNKCEKCFADEEATVEINENDITLTKTGHNMQHKAKVPAKCEEDGCEEYYYCSKCNKYFTDEEGNNVVTLSELKIDATDHDFGDGVVSIEGNVKTTTYTCKNCQTTKVKTEEIKEVVSGNDKKDETKVDKKDDTKVNTGDNSNLVLWFGLLALSIISLFAVRKSTVRR